MTVTTRKVQYHGTGGELFSLMLVNGLLTIVTLTIYSFWGRTRIRQYLYTQTELADDRFAYHGTGGELLRGWLKAALVLAGVFLLLGVVLAVAASQTGSDSAEPPAWILLFNLLYVAVIGTLAAIAINGARRYRLSRSSWRGIRFSFGGRWQDFLALSVKGSILTALTLTLYLPHYRNQARAFLVDHARFGSLSFVYDGDGKELFLAYLKALVLALPTLGLSFAWYKAFEQRYFWSHTTLGPMRFDSSMAGGALLGLALTNLLLVVLTLGIGTPSALTRATRFQCENISLRGETDWATVEQQAQLPGATGEGLAQGLDVDADLGLGM